MACEVARLARLVKGYGDVRRRLVGLFDTGLALAMRVGEVEAKRGTGMVVAAPLTERFRTLVLEDPDGETRAAALAADVNARVAEGDLDGARTLVTTTVIG